MFGLPVRTTGTSIGDDLMSEHCKFPFDDPARSEFKIDENGHFTGFGEVRASFSMINISDQPILSDKKSQGWQIYASNMPLTESKYWLFYIKTTNNVTFKDRYTQGEAILDTDNISMFEFYYNTTNKPLILGNVKNNIALPKISKTNKIKFADFEGIERLQMQDAVQSSEFSYDTVDRTLTVDECKQLLSFFYSAKDGTRLYFIKNGKYQQTGLTIAGLIQPLVNNEIQKIETYHLDTPVSQAIVLDQGGTDWVSNEVATRMLKIDDTEYYVGEITFWKRGFDDEADN